MDLPLFKNDITRFILGIKRLFHNSKRHIDKALLLSINKNDDL